ncbi:MAG: alpha/beta fold hydrolase, partial [Pseudomonadota bacterium]
MPILRVTARPGGLRMEGLDAALGRLTPQAPVVVLVHGYKFSPHTPHADPHRLLYAIEPARACGRIRSWPQGLGFGDRTAAEGLCLGFAWPAGLADQQDMPGRPLAAAYAAAAWAGGQLARLLECIADLAPGRAVDILGHSLGARVALQALAQARCANAGQVILMGAAEYDDTARACLASPAGHAARVFNVTTRENALFDLLFQSFGPPRPPLAHPLGRGLPAHLRQAVDLPLDQPAWAPIYARRGVDLAPARPWISHWSFYTRPGTMTLYRNIIRNRCDWVPAALKTEAAAA